MKRKLTENIPLKIMSLAVGILVWLFVVNIDNPIVTKAITVTNVEVINGAYIDEAGKMIMREERQDPIRVTLRGQRKTLNRITAANVRAVADLQQAVSLETDPVMVPITVTCDGIFPENIDVTPRNLSLHIQEKLTQEFVVNVTTGESKPARGYEVGTKTSSPEQVKITGPVSLINKIDRVTAEISVEGASEDVTKETDLTIYDRNGEALDETELTYLNVPKVTVTAKMWRVRSNVKIQADCTGEPAKGYEIESITTLPETVSVSGSAEALEKLAQQNNIIMIPAEYTDISGRRSDIEEKINITEILPDGLRITSDSGEDVFVRVNILPTGSSVYEMPTSEITVKNKSEDLQVVFDTDRIEIRVKETGENQENLRVERIKASIDVEEKGEGSYEVPVTIILPKGYELVDNVTTEIRISEVVEMENNSG